MDKVCAIVVSYNPDIDIAKNINALIQQVDEVVIVDNGSCMNSKKNLRFLSRQKNVRLICNNKNIGIASALNIGARYALEAGYHWVATFDQDSKITPGFVHSMLTSYKACDYKEKVALVSPIYYDKKTDIKTKRGLYDNNDSVLFSEIEATITSGNLIKSNVFDFVGFFEDSFFIDYVDYEFCLRCRSKGFKIIESPQALLIHSVGFGAKHSFFRKTVVTTNHNHLRRYYNSRNRCVLYKRYILSNPKWVIKDIDLYIKDIVKVLFFEEASLLKTYFIFKGIFHGLINRMGKYG